MKKILTSLFIIGVVGALITGATSAYFTDEGEIEGVTFSTGNADLQMTQASMSSWYAGNASASQLEINFSSDLLPGHEGNWENPDGEIYLGNFSASPISLTVSATVTNYVETDDDMDDTIKMAIAWGGDCDNAGAGTGFYTLAWWQASSADLFTFVSGSAGSADCGFIPNDYIPDGTGVGDTDAKVLKFYLKVPTSAGNEIANGNATFNIHFDAEQKH
ncbi:hypothetical protein ISS42_03140 [Candidatus Shapirobacteria bacterium]|nr:hypothetical protein [Candidatus Shapirobacteria bacterium]